MSAFELIGSGGAEAGGAGVFETGVPNCNLLMVEGGLMESLDRLTSKWEGYYKVGLFGNDYHPLLGDMISRVVPCNFDGYAGLQFTYGWQAATMFGIRAVTQAHSVIWTHNGGLMGNWVYGYYVVDSTGNLVWAERICSGPKLLNEAGLFIRITPRFSLRNEFPENGGIV